MPLLLVAVVYVPLRRALREVTWEVRVRQAVGAVLAESPIARAAVRSSVRVKHGTVNVELVIVGDSSDADALRTELVARIQQVAEVAPTVDVVAVPDALAIRAATEEQRASMTTFLRAQRKEPNIEELRRRVGEVLAAAWPRDELGAVVRWALDPTNAQQVVEVVHVGPPLTVAARTPLAYALGQALKTKVDVRDIALPPDVVVRGPNGPEAWSVALSRALDAAARYEGVYACIESPGMPGADAGSGRDADAERSTFLPSAMEMARVRRARVLKASRWSVRVQARECEVIADAADAGNAPSANGRDH